jgi:hypothetical protein
MTFTTSLETNITIGIEVIDDGVSQVLEAEVKDWSALSIHSSYCVSSSTTTVKVGLTLDISCLNIVCQVLEAEDKTRIRSSSHVVNGVMTFTTSLETNITIGIEVIDDGVSQVLEAEVKDWSALSIHSSYCVSSSTTTVKVGLTLNISCLNIVCQVLEVREVQRGSICSHILVDWTNASEVHEVYTWYVGSDTGRWAGCTGISRERNITGSDGSTDADAATTGGVWSKDNTWVRYLGWMGLTSCHLCMYS